MRTPYGQECPYYYADFNRGRNEQICQLAQASPASEPWIPEVCKDCPMPGIARANACEYMQLRGRVVKGFLGFGRKMIVEAYCTKVQRKVDEPQIGCGECHGDAQIAHLFNE
jgi:hypothetical protein